MLDFDKAFTTWAQANKIAFDDDRTVTIGGSEIGGCARQIGYKKSNTKQDEGYVDGGGFATRGDVMENAALVPLVTTAIETAGGKLLWAGQAEQMRLVNLKKKVSATPDGLAIDMPYDCLAKYGVPDITNSMANGERPAPNATGQVYIEMKSIDPRVSAAKLPKDGHVDQVNLGMGLVRDSEFEHGEIYEPNYAVIIYMNASDYSAITVCVVAFDPEGYKGQLLRAKNIMDAVKQGPVAIEALRPEGKITSDGSCQYCAFSKRCLGYAAMVPRAVQIPDKKVVKQIRKLAGMLQTAQDKAGRFDKAAANIEANLKEVLVSAKTNFLEADGVKLIWSTRDGQERFDTDGAKKKLVELGVDLKDFVKKTKPSESLKVEYVKQLAH